jgi:ATP-dependent Zn protease
MRNILLAAKYLALEEQNGSIELWHLTKALENVQIEDAKAAKVISSLLTDVSFGSKNDIRQENLDKAANSSKVDFAEDVKNLITALENAGYPRDRTISRLNTAATPVSSFEKIKKIKASLQKEAFGQENAVESICDGLMRAEYKNQKNEPHALFLFAGPQSPAKAYIAKALASLMPEYKMVSYKMSTYSSGNGSKQLFGTPAPYSGQKEGVLTDFVKKNPKSILIFEGIELAENETLTALANIVGDGKCDDAFSLESIDFTQTIIILITSSGKEVYSKHEFMLQAQNDQKSAEKMILDALSRERRTSASGHNPGGRDEPVFSSSFMSALRQANVALFGKLGFGVYVELVKKAIVDEFESFERQMGIKVIAADIDALAKLLILSFGPEFDLEGIKERAPSYVLDCITDSILKNSSSPKSVTVSVEEVSKSFINELVGEADDMKLLNTLFRKSQTLKYEYNYDETECKLSFGGVALEKVKKATDYGEEGGFSIELPDVSFYKIAGHHRVKERLLEAIRILKNKTLSEELGRHMPKGMLLYGPPGTGKTMLAKAFAKEADLPFIATTGPDMLNEEMMKKVFEKARDYAPSIVFIDEIDVFKHRGRGYPTDFLINKLLTLIDGFSTNEEERIFIVAATNLKDNIDEAIIRSGRIDLHILVDYLDRDARAWFIDRMLKKDIFDKLIDREKLLKYTANMSGADLQKIENESILHASRKGLDKISEAMLMEQINSLKYGEKIEDEKLEIMLTRTAYHEAGHAVVSKILMPQQKIEQVTVTPRSNALGFVSYDTQEYQNHTIGWFQDRICVCFAGRAAEIKKYGDEGIEAGASNDLKMANHLAYTAITELGMDSRLQNICKSSLGESRIFEAKIEEILHDWIPKMTQKTEDIISEHWDKIEKLAVMLIEKEIVEEDELNSIVKA